MHNVEDLVSEFARINIATMRMVGDEGDVEGADVRDEREPLEEVMLSNHQYVGLNLKSICLPSPCSRWTQRALAGCSFGHW